MMLHSFPSRAWTLGATVLALTTLSALTGCASSSSAGSAMSTLGGMITPYKMDVLQGNVVVREQVQALQPGMQREQVRGILGTPLLASVFHADRWDYVFTFNRQGQEPQQRTVTVFFKNDVLERVDAAADLPSEQEFVASLDVRRKVDKPPVLQASPEDLQAFREKNTSPDASRTEPPPAPAATSYPPLESR